MIKYIFTENTPEIDRMLKEDDKLFKQEVVGKINEIIREINNPKEINIMEDLRTQIAQMDEIAGGLIEKLEDEFTSIPEEPHVQDLLDALDELQNKITAYQEAERWI